MAKGLLQERSPDIGIVGDKAVHAQVLQALHVGERVYGPGNESHADFVRAADEILVHQAVVRAVYRRRKAEPGEMRL